LGVKDDIRKSWFVTTLSVVAAAFFSVALVYSAATYVSVTDARQGIELRDAVEGVELLENGSLELSLTVVLDNPSSQRLTVYSIYWNVKVTYLTDEGTIHIPLVSHYGVPADYAEIAPHEQIALEFHSWISDSIKLASLDAFVNASADEGVVSTHETIPYIHDFRIVAWIGDFEHDYQYSKETYLNDLVRIEKRYFGGVYL
jgi:hypothetical protein